ncbi:hypothetical protein [Streptomyces sp. N50]|uniref:hypothetical protein n=1 Tax=Streptomyces sp. N50 TaxID=3081765 RepID=UPI00296232D6|nr:hypothetical protein [Streptomyces sp. N50]WOX12569.1 hypothetical protein R2B38_28720 [Streptomyces sp. N50]
MTETNEDAYAGALAEYSALRSEITTRINLQHQVLALHMTAVSVVFSVALSGKDRWPVLLVIPFISYASSEILASLFRAVEGIAKYINEELGPKVPGGLGWESWLVQQKPDSEVRRITHPYYLLFPGISIVSLVAIGPLAWTGRENTHQHSAYFWIVAFAWPLAAAFALLSFKAIRRLRAPF